MRLFLLTTATMIAFAANSVLTRLAVDGGHMDPNSFAIVRVLAGAAVLSVILVVRGGRLRLFQSSRAVGAVSLAVYMAGFSLAYLTLDAGLGALVLFGVVQISMFGHAFATGTRPRMQQLAGASVAFLGLVLALWPEQERAAQVTGSAWMVLAGVGWAIYTIAGRAERDPLAATTGNFLLCLPLVVAALAAFAQHMTPLGWGLAIFCGGVTSGVGYALWYTVLPRLPANLAPVVQLSVPIIALIGGAALLGEAVSLRVALAAALVVSGIAMAITARSVPAGRS
ncbi:DMT family transporter [uncultured Roseobacter sp.]|uniref:DMT family transporter n=1 Tax=uncultured Roseobacter sp. TaxID=114847 RepID=UPI00261D3D0C|nr:DMT family transporter [uncultured Roseobacter sp.]